MKGEWAASGATEHIKDYHVQVNSLNAKTAISPYMCERKVRESLEIERLTKKIEHSNF